MEKVYIDSLNRSEDDIIDDALGRGYCAANDPNRARETLGDIMRELYATAYSKGVREQRDFESNKRRDPVNYHNGE